MFEVLTYRSLWDDAIRHLPPSPTLSPTYWQAFSRYAYLAIFKASGCDIVYPFILEGGDVRGAGFSGPLAFGYVPTKAIAEFNDNLDEWLSLQGVASEFYMPNPFEARHVRRNLGTIVEEKPVVTIETGDLLDRKDISPTQRNSIRAIHKAGAVFEFGHTKDFIAIYQAAMERKGASERWRFTAAQLSAFCGEVPGAFLVQARIGGIIQGMALVFASGPEAVYFLAATIDGAKSGVGAAVLAHAAKEAGVWGSTRMILGGGVTKSGDDSLLAFKRSFGGFQTVAKSYRRVHDEIRYRQKMAVQGARMSAGMLETTNFFPLYRKDAA